MADIKNYGAEGSHPPEVISQDANNRFVTDAQIEQWTNGTAGQGQFMSMVYRRSSTVPVTPVGGGWTFPIPDGGTWTHTILPGTDPVFASSRFFTSDGLAPQQDVWSPPVLFVRHGSLGSTGEKGDKGDPGLPGLPGVAGLNGSNGVNGNNGTSIVWLGEADAHPLGAEDGFSYKNTANKRSYIFWDGVWYQMTIDGIDGIDGQEGVSIVWKGDLATPPADPQINWAYRDTDNHVVYIYTAMDAWEVMLLDGNDGVAGAAGANGLSVYITYHDADPQGIAPVPPDNIAGDSNGWHTNATAEAGWMSQKVDDGTGIGWGLAIAIRGANGASGPRGSNSFVFEESDAGTTYITPAVAASWAGTLTNEAAQAVARDMILSGLTNDSTLRPNDKITVTDVSAQLAGTRVYLGAATEQYITVLATHFSGLITEAIDGNMIIHGTVAVDALSTDIVSAGKINTTLLTGAKFQTDDDFTPNGKVIIDGATNDFRVYDASGNLRVRMGKLT